jgi:hypothetical protein
MTPEEDPLVKLAAAVADVSVVDWDVAQKSAGSAQNASAIGEFQILAEIPRLHRESGLLSADVRDCQACG